MLLLGPPRGTKTRGPLHWTWLHLSLRHPHLCHLPPESQTPSQDKLGELSAICSFALRRGFEQSLLCTHPSHTLRLTEVSRAQAEALKPLLGWAGWAWLTQSWHQSPGSARKRLGAAQLGRPACGSDPRSAASGPSLLPTAGRQAGCFSLCWGSASGAQWDCLMEGLARSLLPNHKVAKFCSLCPQLPGHSK